MKTIVVNSNDAGRRIDKFLSMSVKNLPVSLAYKYIRKKRIKINGKRCSVSQILNEGDEISLYVNDEFFEETPDKFDFLKATKPVKIAYEDENVLIVDKEPGLIVHPDANVRFDCLINRIRNYLYLKGEYDPKKENSFSPSLVNRIDLNTGGIVIAAKNYESLKVLSAKMKAREIQKYYICIVHGRMNRKRDVLKGYLKKNENLNVVYVSEEKFKDSKPILTKYSVLGESKNLSLLEIELLTGRTHQIRAHLASVGNPILGDGKYGRNADNSPYGYKRQALYSYKLKFNFSTPGSTLDYLNGKEFSVNEIWFLKELGDSFKPVKN